jgi:hypothetical protein
LLEVQRLAGVCSSRRILHRATLPFLENGADEPGENLRSGTSCCTARPPDAAAGVDDAAEQRRPEPHPILSFPVLLDHAAQPASSDMIRIDVTP